jgi:hypothetical protein
MQLGRQCNFSRKLLLQEAKAEAILLVHFEIWVLPSNFKCCLVRENVRRYLEAEESISMSVESICALTQSGTSRKWNVSSILKFVLRNALAMIFGRINPSQTKRRAILQRIFGVFDACNSKIALQSKQTKKNERKLRKKNASRNRFQKLLCVFIWSLFFVLAVWFSPRIPQ